ncbi:uncharacterized protein M6B38_336815 [Iris pallida]|uniref:Protein AATF n=1 Tax=Iris pallida TaxID=29817 RepID=A0AAX6GZZ3_IRIPA|nr:uncharacterized protein M6B38_336815 [Iris pallida]
MGRASKRSKQVEEEKTSTPEPSRDSESETRLDSNWSDDSDFDEFDDGEENESASDGNSDEEEENMMDDDDGGGGGGDKQIRGQNDAEMEELEKEYNSLRNEQFDEFDDGEENESASEGNSDEEEENMMDDDGGGGGGDKQIRGKNDAEMEELEKEYNSLRNEQDLLKNLKRHKDEDAIKGQAVKNQKALWDKTLEFRFLLQKPFSSSNKLPQEPVKSSFCSSDKVVDEAYADLVSSCKQTLDFMLELQEALLEQNHSIVESTAGNTKQSSKDGLLPNELKGEADEDWLQIHEMQSRIAPFRNNAVDKWHRKTQVTTGAAAFKGKLHAFNQNISDQVAGYMRDPSRMINRMQLGSFSVGIFGKVPENSESIKEEDVNVEGDPELLDDSEFYQQLLKEFFESCDLTSSVMAFHAMKKLQPKKRKIVDRRASKSRKIRYSVHEKIVNFMAPVPMNLPQMAPKLFENLFGMGNQKAASVLQPAAVGMS